jgi:hypothetical protein
MHMVQNRTARKSERVLASAGWDCFDRVMRHSDKTMPAVGPEAARAQAERAAREAAALRENLRKRKAQARARQDDEPGGQNVPDTGETR